VAGEERGATAPPLLEIANQGQTVLRGRNNEPLLQIAQQGFHGFFARQIHAERPGEGALNDLAGRHPCCFAPQQELLPVAETRQAFLKLPQRGEATLELSQVAEEGGPTIAEPLLADPEGAEFHGSGVAFLGQRRHLSVERA
jgi:hypothetical protein